jgi:hypothetical protein
MGDAGGPGGKLTGSDHVPEVSRLASPPLAAINQMWVDCEGPVTNESLAPTSNASRNLASPSRFGASSMAAYATVAPSGFQANCVTGPAEWVSCRESPPPIGKTKTWPLWSLSSAI